MLGRLGALLAQIARRPTEHARSLRAFPRFLAQPIVAAVLASGLTALLLAGPPEVVTVKEVRVVERIPGTTRYVTVNRSTCDTATVAKLLNEVTNSSARTGTASFDNESASSVSTPGGGAHATGDSAAAISQEATATSGNAVLGQIIDTLNICGTTTINATNQVSDSKAVTGDAEVENRADVGVGGARLAPASPSPSPSPEVAEQIVATPTASATAVATEGP